MPAIKTGMTNVAGHFCSHIGTVSQPLPVAVSQVHGGIWEPGLTCAQTWGGMQTYLIPLATQRRPPPAHPSHGTHHTEAIWVSWSTKIKNNNNLQEMNQGECILFALLYVSVRSSISSALRYGRPSWMSVKSTWGAGDSLGGGPLLPRLSKPRRPPPRYIWNQDGHPSPVPVSARSWRSPRKKKGRVNSLA